MGSKIGQGVRATNVGYVAKNKISNVKRFRNIQQTFSINLNDYGGSIDSAKEQIKSISETTIDGYKNKVKKLDIFAINGSELFQVKLKIKVWI